MKRGDVHNLPSEQRFKPDASIGFPLPDQSVYGSGKRKVRSLAQTGMILLWCDQTSVEEWQRHWFVR